MTPMTQPLRFHPLFMERVWGGRQLETLYGKALPPQVPIGESWELVDRPEAQSVVAEGPLAGTSLHTLWSERRAEIFGERHRDGGPRFPLLFKLLDAAERLSVQVHPPAAVASELDGEPKTEMWYVTAAMEEADLFAGLAPGSDRARFEAALASGGVEALLHRLPSRAGDCIFIPSGRVHAIGAGNVIVEVQQNSDTTYRVFDWNRVGLDGKPRALHIDESLRSIDFDDIEPGFQPPGSEPLVRCPYFQVSHWELEAPREAGPAGDFAVITVLSGGVTCAGAHFRPGDFFLVPASLKDRTLHPQAPGTAVLRTVA